MNQYTTIGDFTPQFDAAGNQTRVKTSTGIWQVSYNAENRPVRFESEDGSTIVECTYDYMGCRATKKVTDNGSITQHQRYIYRGYLQIACCDHTRSTTPCLWLITWESPRGLGGGLDKPKGFAPQGRAADGAAASQPSQPIATRPLAIRKDGTWYVYGWDLTKNICEIYGPTGYIRTLYTYSPYGIVTAEGDVTQPIQWSSEFSDSELDLVYYNYRYYIPKNGYWIRRDPLHETDSLNCYSYVNNRLITNIDIKGLERITINDCTSLKVELVTKGFWGYDTTEIFNDSTLHVRDGFYIIITSMWKTSDECQKEKESYFKCFPYSVDAKFAYGNAAWQSYFTGVQYKTILGLLDRNEISMGTAVLANAGNSNLAVASGSFYVRRSQLLKKASINIDILVFPDRTKYKLNYNVVFDNNIGSLDFDSHYVTK